MHIYIYIYIYIYKRCTGVFNKCTRICNWYRYSLRGCAHWLNIGMANTNQERVGRYNHWATRAQYQRYKTRERPQYRYHAFVDFWIWGCFFPGSTDFSVRSTCTLPQAEIFISWVPGLHILPSKPDSAMQTSADQISSYPTATFCRSQGIEPATFRFMLEKLTTEPHAQDISADNVRVWLSGYILQQKDRVEEKGWSIWSWMWWNSWAEGTYRHMENIAKEASWSYGDSEGQWIYNFSNHGL